MHTSLSLRFLVWTFACCAATLGTAGAACIDDVQQLANDYRLPLVLSKPAPNAPSTVPGADTPVTNESRGVTAGPDTVTNSGATTPSAITTQAGTAVQLGADDRAKAEGFLAQAAEAAGQGDNARCARLLDEAQALPHGSKGE